MMEVFLHCPVWQPQATRGYWKDEHFSYLTLINLNLNVNNHMWLVTAIMGSSVLTFSNKHSNFQQDTRLFAA